jgi:hypothetical protein
LALSDLILHGVLDRHPRLCFGVVELSSAWVPQFLLMLDGAAAFTTLLNGAPVAKLSRRPSEYFLDHRRVSSFAYENPKRLAEIAGDVFMFCSDYPHSEGTASPLDDYRRTGCEDQQNARSLSRQRRIVAQPIASPPAVGRRCCLVFAQLATTK